MLVGENAIKISILTKAHIHSITTNISMTIFTETETILTSVWSPRGPRRARETLRRENRLVSSPSLTSIYITHLKAPQDV